MAYSELIKNFEKIRDYMRDFYVYGFKTRTEFNKKSSRSYDNERRRVESWLSDYMSFKQNENGKNVFISVDARHVTYNPLYRAFKTKSFTDNDIVLHFYILDILSDDQQMTAREISEIINDEYLSFFETDIMPDDSTIRNKLKEYASIGILKTTKRGKELLYSRNESNVRLDTLQDAIAFSSETNPSGVIGSILLDKYEDKPDYFSYKHHYFLTALDQEILISILLYRKEKKSIEITLKNKKTNDENNNIVFKVFPLRIYSGTQNGKQHLLAYSYERKRPTMFRLDKIVKVKPLKYEENHELYDSYLEGYRKNLWGVNDGMRNERESEHVELVIHVGDNEDYIINRLRREKRCGEVSLIDKNTVMYTADVYSAQEMVPWIRTFIGRIESFTCSNEYITRRFYKDIEEMKNIYGGEEDDLS